jgi:hypothetical protein
MTLTLSSLGGGGSSGSSSTTQLGDQITVTSSTSAYTATVSLVPGVYTVYNMYSVPEATIEFYSSATNIVTSMTTTASVQYINVGTAVTKINVTSGYAPVTIFMQLVATPISTSTFSGAIDVITSSGTYTGTSPSGYGYVMVVGGGGGQGSAGQATNTYYNAPTPTGGGGVGGLGGLAFSDAYPLTGSISVTIGAGGTSSTVDNFYNGYGTASYNPQYGGYYSVYEGTAEYGATGGTTTFGTLSANGGAGGQPLSIAYGNAASTGGAVGAAGTPTYSVIPFQFITTAIVPYGQGGYGDYDYYTGYGFRYYQVGTGVVETPGTSGTAGAVWVFRY